MARLEDLKEGVLVKGIRPDGPVTIINVKWHGDSVVEVTYKDPSGRPGNELLFRDREPTIEVIEPGQSWSFDADAGMLRLVSEAYRIRMAYLFDPLLAVHTSLIDPLPHQITAVYEEMIPRHPLRYLLADDPGAGKTIMAGLFIKELMVRGDLDRCMIVCPGNLVDQWQDELYRRLHLPFEILTNDRLEAARTGNAFQEIPLLIARLDKLSRNEDVQAKLKQTDWDLIICDEAHKMSASFFGGEIKETKRRKLGGLLSELTRHFLLMTATPHNGKEEDFQLFMALLDGDRFEGRFRDGVHTTDVSDLMRRMVKEDLVKFDGTPLFPERLAYTVTYRLSDKEAALYEQVTNYVREEFNRADALESEGRKGTVGFALTILQRRLASSPEAIYRSLRRRRERLESRLREEELLKRGAESRAKIEIKQSIITEEDIDATIDIILERYRNILRQGAVFLNESDPSENVQALFYIEHSVADARTDKRGERRVVSRQIQFVEINEQGDIRNAGYAPYLDYRPLTEEERSVVAPYLQQGWLQKNLESRAISYAITHLVPRHFKEVRDRKEELVTKTIAAVKERLTKEIAYWDHRAEELKAQELAGKINARINSGKARARADELQARLQRRLEELEKEKQLSPLPPVVMGGALVVSGGLLARLRCKRDEEPDLFARETKRVEQIAMQAVMELERSLNYSPRDVSQDNCGYDIESAVPDTGKLRFIEVKGRLQGAKTVTMTKNEILTALNKPDDFILAIVLVPPSDEGPRADPWEIGDPAAKYGTTRDGCRIYYIRRPFTKEPDFGVTSVNYDLSELLERAEDPR